MQKFWMMYCRIACIKLWIQQCNAECVCQTEKQKPEWIQWAVEWRCWTYFATENNSIALGKNIIQSSSTRWDESGEHKENQKKRIRTTKNATEFDSAMHSRFKWNTWERWMFNMRMIDNDCNKELQSSTFQFFFQKQTWTFHSMKCSTEWIFHAVGSQ